MILTLVGGQISWYLLYSVPSGAPQSLEAMFVQSTEVSLRWKEVPCIQQNGPITGYVVWYYPTHGADGDVQQNKSVATTGGIIDGLTPNTEYAFQVAAVNVNGTGPLSEPIMLGGNSKVNKLWAACFMHSKNVYSICIYVRDTGRLYLIVGSCTVNTTDISTALQQPVNNTALVVSL